MGSLPLTPPGKALSTSGVGQIHIDKITFTSEDLKNPKVEQMSCT